MARLELRQFFVRFQQSLWQLALGLGGNCIMTDDPSLSTLRNKNTFESWEGFVDSRIIEESRRVYKDTIESLLGLENNASAEERLRILERYVERFNELDKIHGHFIYTIEREDICEYFGQIADILGLGGVRECDDLPNVARDW